VVGILIGLTICLGLITTASLASMMFLMWWTLDSGRRHSIGAGRQMQLAAEMQKETVVQTAATTRMLCELTETLLLGRKNLETEPQLSVERTSETWRTPDDLWAGLPENIQAAMVREAEEAATWPSPSETLHAPSTNGHANRWLDDEPVPSSSPTP
jgi:hypothetical protein